MMLARSVHGFQEKVATPKLVYVPTKQIPGGQDILPEILLKSTTPQPDGVAAESEATSPLLQKYLTESGGRWGGTTTRVLNDQVATDLESQGFSVTNGAGRGSEEWIPGPGGSTTGGTWVDITATNGSQTVRVQTVTTLADGVTPTPSEAAAAARIRAAFPNDQLILIPKKP